ncbi:unnamed protein product [Linum tenue]|uniref:Uncharacterized protein n=1 Tax=Linum tenue TaxID=586396 RepID=A0AAV0IY13_9ROSI|nr:unnamed protein product [Linum tenue]
MAPNSSSSTDLRNHHLHGGPHSNRATPVVAAGRRAGTTSGNASVETDCSAGCTYKDCRSKYLNRCPALYYLDCNCDKNDCWCYYGNY